MFSPGEDVEVFVDRKDSRKLVPSLVARWYFRVSSRMIGPAADDPEWDFTNPPPRARENSEATAVSPTRSGGRHSSETRRHGRTK